MRLSEFILTNRERILEAWEAHARSCKPASRTMDIEELRDHAGQMLSVIAADLDTPQNREEEEEKSKGEGAGDRSAGSTAAEKHGADRAESGFTVKQMVSEFRSLRATVIRLWRDAKGDITPADLEDVARFNEAVDQSLAESVDRFSEELNESKEMFLAMLGHDLRTPVGSILTSAQFILETEELDEPARSLISRIAGTSTRMVQMVEDLLDFTRSRLGGGIPIERTRVSMGKLVHDVVGEVRGAYPKQTIHIDTRAEPEGEWDPARISQMLSNLIGNAAEHASADTPIEVELAGHDEEIALSIHNLGPTIPPDQVAGIFSPMKASKGEDGAGSGPSAHLGLGLYIAERIAHAHGGRIDVESSEADGTTFTAHLPRHG